jgi:hypothetical protein
VQFKNSTDYPDYMLRRMVSWCCKQLDMPVRRVRAVQFTNCSRYWRGRAWSRRILVRIGPDAGYPYTGKYPGRTYAPTYTVNDRTEALVKVTAHELAHLARWADGIYKVREATVDGMAIPILKRFVDNREELLAEWNVAPAAKAPKPKPGRQQQNEAKARDALARWERKMKLAKTKVAAYRKRVRYYDRVAASRQ